MPVSLSEALEEHQRGNFERASALYNAALASDPDQPDALYLLGLVAIQKGDPRQAVLLIGRAAMLRPGDAVIHGNLGEAYRALGDIDRTIECCRTALRLDPNHPDSSLQSGLGPCESGRPRNGHRPLSRRDPAQAGIRWRTPWAGQGSANAGAAREAKDCFVEALASSPDKRRATSASRMCGSSSENLSRRCRRFATR